MKKNLIIAATGILGACVILTGCTITPKVSIDGNVNVNGSEVFSDSFSYDPAGATSEKDGPGPDEAVSVLFERVSDNEKATEKAVISGLNMAGGRVWTYETKEDYIGQVDSLQEIGYFGDKYIFVAFGDVICLDYMSGKELWVNQDFKGYGISWTTNDKEDTLYMCGYFGPDVFVMDLDGKTLNRITSKDDDTYWAYEIKYINDNRVDVTYESTETVVSYDPNGPAEQ